MPDAPDVRRSFFGAALLAGALLGACGGGDPPPDVLIVLADDLDWSELAKSPKPSIDRLASEGVTLRQFIAMPVCSSARHALLHGRWPRRSGVGGNVNSHAPPSARNPTPSEELVSLPKLLRARGYHTALIGKWHLGQVPPEGGRDPMTSAPHAHGFDHWLAGSPANLQAGKASGYDDWLRVDDGQQRRETEYATRAQREAALAWWRETPSPKFMLVALNAPHAPIHIAPLDMIPPGIKPGKRSRLHSMIGTVDDVVGHLREAVDPERTLFLFLADNGVMPAVEDAEEAKGTTAERGICVPFVASGPGLARGEGSDALVSIVDVLATVADATGTAHPDAGPGAEDSRSFYGALVDPASWRAARPWVLSERYEHGSDDLAIRTARWKLRQIDGRELLVDLSRDPQEEQPYSVEGGLDGEARAAVDELRRIRASEVPPRAP